MDQSQPDILGFRPEAISDPVRRLKYCNAVPHRFPVHSVPVPNNFRLHRTCTVGQNSKKLLLFLHQSGQFLRLPE